VTIELSAVIDPSDRSMPPLRMTRVWPTASVPVMLFLRQDVEEVPHNCMNRAARGQPPPAASSTTSRTRMRVRALTSLR